ncbi:GNAT family N-acetyltransferase [Aquincola tertiaricarbonis]|uniref:GNAT family N-acetyltransferase n=1 Tax=Aquincola tertiaricarbonis TaxID=391953 RepID=A0ABY4S7U7_AQUTE|nr:GNAT family N-acetyltransferase [Aquincola tertiaricarbonis]URI08529.1 GNAT family N-acetyltransferase [Aquincola tertiaricarbonis]
MDWINGLEPAALVGWFLREPPQGFAVLQQQPPAFAADFDLLTTADDELRATLARLPGHRWWSRWLRVHTAFVGTTVSEYALLPAARAPRQVVQALLQRWRPGHRLLIVKDLPQDSPLLSDAHNQASTAFAQACEEAGFLLLEGQALAYVPIDFASEDEYLGRLSPARRQNLRRKLRSRARLQVARISTGVAFADDATVDAYYALYEAVYAQSEIHFDKLTRAFFAGLLRDTGAGGIVFEYRSAADDQLLGWNLCFEHGGKLIDKYIGLRYPAAREHNLYFVSWMENLAHARERGLSHYVAGWTDPQVKRQLGARFTFTRHAVYIRQPWLRALGRRLAGRFESDRAWVQAEAR